MELFSKNFSRAVQRLFEAGKTSNFRILATVPLSKGRPLPLVESIKQKPDCKMFTVIAIDLIFKLIFLKRKVELI